MKWLIIILLLTGIGISQIDFMLLEGGNPEFNVVRNPFTVTSTNGTIDGTTTTTLPHPGHHEGGGGGNLAVIFPMLFVFTLIMILDDTKKVS